MTPRPIAALFVATGGCYFGVDGVDPWDEPRDALGFKGSEPVVAHPPCARWCRLAGLVEARYGLKKGDDGGLFAFALAAVRENGGVLEHPAYSDAWPAFELTRPPKAGGWVKADEHGGSTCHVEQRHYGHPARKATWLYAVRCQLPELRWGPGPRPVAWCAPGGGRGRRGDGSFFQRDGVRTMPRSERLATPPAFRDVLIAMARSAA